MNVLSSAAYQVFIYIVQKNTIKIIFSTVHIEKMCRYFLFNHLKVITSLLTGEIRRRGFYANNACGLLSYQVVSVRGLVISGWSGM